ncbi:MAG: NUDIX domain-containing protein [Propionibacteriaceae bacterium]|jgi:8-oxo-dGTP pyrophosphatase MutT (NUDIX family)|nr:NUDIX domain-containing protein [Propionibacteriaceae bacterium]
MASPVPDDVPRSLTAIEPALRRRHRRQAVRVIVSDGTAVLLLADSDPGKPGSQWWVTPGGGIDVGESPEAAAVRELFEEVGLVAAVEDLVGPVARRLVIHGYSDHILEQSETFYLLRTARFEADDSGHTEIERATLLGYDWITITDLGNLDIPLWPANLTEMLAHADHCGSPLELGTVEESTVPVE